MMAEVAHQGDLCLPAKKKDRDVAREKDTQERPIKLDSKGLPLVPQPSDRKDDPLVRVDLLVVYISGRGGYLTRKPILILACV